MADIEEQPLPRTFEEFNEQRKAAFIRVKDYKQAGNRLVGFLCSYTPLEIIDAAGAASVALCGTSDEVIPEAEKVLPANLCPLIKSTYGFAYSQKCPFTYFSDMIIGETTSMPRSTAQSAARPPNMPVKAAMTAEMPHITPHMRRTRGVHTSGFLYFFRSRLIHCHTAMITPTAAPAKNGIWCTSRKSSAMQHMILPILVLSPLWLNHR